MLKFFLILLSVTVALNAKIQVGDQYIDEQNYVKSLKEYEKSARFHSDEQLEQIEKSIKKFGFTNPVLIDEDDFIIAGHGRKLAAIGAGLTELPCIVLAGLSDAEKKAYRIADNRLPQNGKWDADLLATEFQEIYNSGFDLEYTGFTENEINRVMDSLELPRPSSEASGEGEPQEIETTAGPSPEDPAEEINKPEKIETKSDDNLESILIKVPVKHAPEIKSWLANGSEIDPINMGIGVLQRAGIY